MNSRERVIAAINFMRPDRCPIMHSILPGAALKYGEGLFAILRRYPNDFGPSEFKVPRVEELTPDYRKGVHRDDWGTTWRSTVDGIHGQVYDYPLKDYGDLADYKFPPLPNEEDIETLKTRVKETKDKGYFAIAGFNPGNYFERMQWLRGFVNLMGDFSMRTKGVYRLADLLLEYCLQAMGKTLEAKPHMVSLGDDWGTQEGLMVSPTFWREFFKPRYRRMFDLVHDHGAYVWFHSDGYIMDIIPDLYEIGVNVLWPQFSCHNLEELAEATRERICVASDIDRQYIMPRGTPEEARAYVKRVIDLFGYGSNGGLIGRGEVNIDVPLENVEAVYETFFTYGRYTW